MDHSHRGDSSRAIDCYRQYLRPTSPLHVSFRILFTNLLNLSKVCCWAGLPGHSRANCGTCGDVNFDSWKATGQSGTRLVQTFISLHWASSNENFLRIVIIRHTYSSKFTATVLKPSWTSPITFPPFATRSASSSLCGSSAEDYPVSYSFPFYGKLFQLTIFPPSSPQFRSAVSNFDQALRTGMLGGLVRTLGLPEEAGTGIGPFLRAVQEQAEMERSSESNNTMDTDWIPVSPPFVFLDMTFCYPFGGPAPGDKSHPRIWIISFVIVRVKLGGAVMNIFLPPPWNVRIP